MIFTMVLVFVLPSLLLKLNVKQLFNLHESCFYFASLNLCLVIPREVRHSFMKSVGTDHFLM